MNSAKALAAYIGQTGTLAGPGLRPAVRILDAREVWGRVDLLVEPVAGCGTEWVHVGRVYLAEPEAAK